MSELLPQLADLLPLLPGAVIGLVLVVVASRWRAGGVAVSLAALAPVAALFVTWWQLHGTPPLPPVQSTERVLWSALAWAVCSALLSVRRPWTVIAAAAVATGLTIWVLGPLVDRPIEDPTRVSLAWCSWVGAGIALLATGAGAAAKRMPGIAVPGALALGIGAAGQIMVLFGSASLAQLLGGLALVFALAAVAIVALRERVVPAAAVAAVVGVSALLVVDGQAFLDATPPARALLPLSAVPLVPWLSRAPWVRELCATRRAVLVLGAALLVTGVAVGLGVAGMPAPDPYGDLYK